MDIILGLVMMVFGIVSLVRGELKLSASSVARGRSARVAALFLIAAFPLALVVGLLRAAAERAAQRPLFGEVFSGMLSYIILLGCAVAAVVVVQRSSHAPATGG